MAIFSRLNTSPTTNMRTQLGLTRGIHFRAKGIEAFPLERRAEQVPVQYTPDEWTDLVAYMRPHAEDPDARLALPPGPGVSSRTTRMKRLKFYDECWIRSATRFTTVPGRPKAPSPLRKLYARSRAHVGTTLG